MMQFIFKYLWTFLLEKIIQHFATWFQFVTCTYAVLLLKNLKITGKLLYSRGRLFFFLHSFCLLLKRPNETQIFFFFFLRWSLSAHFVPSPSTLPVFLHVIVIDIDQLQRVLFLVGTPEPELFLKISSESVSVKWKKKKKKINLLGSATLLHCSPCVCAGFGLVTTLCALSWFCSWALVSAPLGHKTVFPVFSYNTLCAAALSHRVHN